MMMTEGLPGIASEEAESEVLLLGNAHRLSRTYLCDLALARGPATQAAFQASWPRPGRTGKVSRTCA
jgi:hypothetical protein